MGLSCVSAADVDDISDLSADNSDDIISIDESTALADSAGSTTVYNWTELGSAVSEDNNIETVYIGANMTPTEQITINHNVTIIGSADTYIGGANSTDPVSYSYIPIYSNEPGLTITLKNIRFQNAGGNILMQYDGNGTYLIEDCSFVNMTATGSHQAVVYLHLGKMNITGCTFENCTTSYGAVSNFYANGDKVNVRMVVRDTTFKKNHATSEPGAINNCGYLEVYDSTFEENTAAMWAGAIHTHYGAETHIEGSEFNNNAAKGSYNGGALYTYSTLTVKDSTFTGNRAPNGGAISGMSYMSAASVTLDNCEFKNNTATGSGGAISLGGASFIAENSRFYDNTAANNGGAISVSTAVANITNCEFKSNSAHNNKNTSKGGAVYFNSANGNLIASTFEDCSSDDGGSVYWNNDDGLLSGCDFRNSHADNNGGAVYWAGDNGTIEKSNFKDCEAENYGGGIYFEGEDCTLADSSFEGNNAVEGPNWYTENDLDVINVTINKTSTSISAPDVEIDCGSTGNLTATLTDDNNTALAGENIVISFNGSTYSETTDENGQVTIAIPDNLIPDVYEAKISYNGSEKYDPSKATAKVTVNKISTVLTADDVVTFYNSGDKLVATLTDANGTAISAAKVKIVLGALSKTLLSDENGQVALSTDAVVPGDYTAEISFAGDEIYGESSATAEVTISKLNSTLTAKDVITVYGSGSELVATLTDADGNAIGGAQIKIVLDTISKTLITDGDGKAALSTDAFSPGDYTADITFAGDEIYNPASATAKVKIGKLNSTLTAKDVITVYGSADKLVATLTDANGTALASMQVRVVLGSIKKTLITDANGQISLSTDGLLPDTYTADITFAGDEIYNAASASAKVTIEKLNSTLTAKDVITVYNSADKLIATLTDAKGEAITGAKVKIVLGTLSKTLTTDAKGQVTLTTSGVLPGTYTADITFAGDEIYNPASTTASVVIGKLNTVLNASDVVTVYNGGKNLIATLKDSQGNAVEGAQIKIVLGALSKTLTTDAKGQVELSTDGLVPDTYTADITFAGDEIYGESGTTAKVTVLPLGTEIVAEASGDYTVVEVEKNTAIFNMTLMDENGNCLANRTITIEFNGAVENLTTGDKGTVEYLITAQAGEYTLTMTFAGDDCYTKSSATADISIVAIKTEIDAPESVEYTIADVQSGNAVFNLTLVDEDGDVVANRPVSITFNGVTQEITTDANGVASYLINATAGNYTIDMAFKADGYYEASNASSTVIIKDDQRKESKIFLRNALYFVMETKMVKVTLWDADNNPIAGKTVHIAVYENRYSGITDENGTATIRVGVGFGVHNATVSFDGDDEYAACNRTGSIRVIKETPSVMVRGADTKFKVSDQHKVVKVYLWDRTSKPLPANSKIAIKVNGQTFVGYTDSEGIASIEIQINKPGTFNAEVRYAGNSAYNAVTREVKFQIQ